MRAIGDRAIAKYVRKHHPEIVEQATKSEAQRLRRHGKWLAKNHAAQAQQARGKDGRARKLLAELAALGVFVAENGHNNGTNTRRRVARV